MTYPAHLPNPLIQNHEATVGLGVRRTIMTNGQSRQRRVFTHQPHTVQLHFAIPLTQWQEWHNWVRDNAYTTFDGMRFASFATTSGTCSNHWVKFISNLTVQSRTRNAVIVSVDALMQPYDGLNTPPPISAGQWIIANTPANPSSPDWVLAGTPDSPNAPNPSTPSWIIPGTPQAPSVIV